MGEVGISGESIYTIRCRWSYKEGILHDPVGHRWLTASDSWNVWQPAFSVV